MQPTFILPEHIDHQAWVDLMQFIIKYRHNEPVSGPLNILCTGNGGASTYAHAIASAIQKDNFTGILHGYAYSGHSLIFAACKQRFVDTFAALFVHGPVLIDDATLTHEYVKAHRKQSKVIIDHMARLYASSCTSGPSAGENNPALVDEKWWRKYLRKHITCTPITAVEMIGLGMAKRLKEVVPGMGVQDA